MRAETEVAGKYHHGNLREALLDATLDLVARDGVSGFSLNGAARAAGVSRAAPYRHFANKEALLTAAVDRGFSRLREQLEIAAQPYPDDPLARLGALGTVYVTFAMENPAAFRLLFHESRPHPSNGGRATFAVLNGCVDQAHRDNRLRADLEATDVVRAAWALVHGLVTLHLDGALGPAPLPALDHATIKSTIATFIAGIRRP
jgi:AcrR family transcriptional regulator